MSLSSFKELTVWQRSMQLARSVYVQTRELPADEKYGLVSQMRRCAISIPSNIAEGSKRGSRKDYVQFLRIADASAAELETQVLLAEELYMKTNFENTKKLLDEVQRMLSTLIKKLVPRT